MILRPGRDVYALRAGRDDDAPGFIALIGACWAEYPGCVMDMQAENHELLALATYFTSAGGALWVSEHNGEIEGMIGTRPAGQGAWEICKVYVAAQARGTGLAAHLLATAEAHAKAAGATDLVLWSDTRFDRAHRFYERHFYIRQRGIRALHDLSNSLEYGYAKPMTALAIRRLDIAAAESAARALGRILSDCVHAGASVSFLPPLDLPRAEAFYRARTSQIAAGTRILLAAWTHGTLAGSVMLDLDMPQNQPHRGEIQKLLVSPASRRQGVARALMQEAEAEAIAARRTLLLLDTREGDSAEPLYRSMGWIESGRVPGFAVNAEGGLDATVFFYRQLAT